MWLELDLPERRRLVRLSSGVVHASQGRIGAEDIGFPNPFARYRLRPERLAGLGNNRPVRGTPLPRAWPLVLLGLWVLTRLE